MLSYQQIWDLVEPIVGDEGLRLFDIEISSASSSTLVRVFIKKAVRERNGDSLDPKACGVQIDDCVKVSRRLSFVFDASDDIPDNYQLEVSSPGVNRKLRKPEHFSEAVGERAKLKLYNSLGDRNVLLGELVSFGDDQVEICDEQLGQVFCVELSNIKKAHVEYNFGE